MKYIKEELEYLIFVKKLSYIEIGKIYNVSDTYIKKISNKLGINLPIRAKFPQTFIPHNKKNGVEKYCKYCGKTLTVVSWNKFFCNRICACEYRKNKTIQYYLNNQNEFHGKIKTMNFIKPYLLKKQNYKCEICGSENIWNNKPIVFILDHIDGDASNNKLENLRLVCPNCDSQLDTYKSKNKNSARKERYLKNYK